MKLKFYFLILLFLVVGGLAAQNDTEETIIEEVNEVDTVSNLDESSLLIKDDMTVDPEQNKKWRKGLYKYPAKPKHAWELGIHGGHYFLDGDVDNIKPLSGFGIGLHLRRAIHYAFSVRFDLFYGQTYGTDPQPTLDGLTPENNYGGMFNDYVNAVGFLGEDQAGFRHGYSTLDHVFVLNSIVDIYLQKRKKLYCAFIDYSKTFDLIDRASLWCKLLSAGINGKIITVIYNLYQNAKSCVKLNGNLSEFFSCSRGANATY